MQQINDINDPGLAMAVADFQSSAAWLSEQLARAKHNEIGDADDLIRACIDLASCRPNLLSILALTDDSIIKDLL